MWHEELDDEGIEVPIVRTNSVHEQVQDKIDMQKLFDDQGEWCLPNNLVIYDEGLRMWSM